MSRFDTVAQIRSPGDIAHAKTRLSQTGRSGRGRERRWRPSRCPCRPCRRQPVPPELTGTEFTLQIAPVTVELAPNRIVSTIGYNGMSPGPLLRMKEGVPVTVNVVNKTDVPEFVHFHGLLIPSDVDGSEEEGTPVGAAARKPQLSIHAHARGHALVSHPHHVDGRSAPRQLHRNVRLSDRRGREQSRQLRSGTLPGAARLGAVLHRPVDG